MFRNSLAVFVSLVCSERCTGSLYTAQEAGQTSNSSTLVFILAHYVLSANGG
jgi:hypothetical protein